MNEHERIVGIIRTKNATPLELDPERTALIVVDMQRLFTEPSHPFTEMFERLSPGATGGYLGRVRGTVIPAIRSLLDAFRELRAPIVFTAVRTDAGDGRDLPGWLRALDGLGLATLDQRVWPPAGDPSADVDPAVAPGPGEVVLAKLSAGAFATTGLEQRLRHLGTDTVVVCGVTTDVCVSTTAREAADRGFRTVVVSDGSAALSDAMHGSSLDAFNLAFGWVRSAEEILSSIARTRGCSGGRRRAGSPG